MEYRKLGNTELELSAITYGAFAIGGNMWGGNEKKDSIDSIHASIDNGVTTIDTAPFYGFGLSEEMIGEALQSQNRSKVQLLTKFGLVWDGSNKGKGDFFFDADDNEKKLPVYKFASKENIIKEVEESLKRLKTDYIDLLQIHWPDSTTPIQETMEAMDLLIKQGKIRAAGVCNYDVSQLKEAQKTISLASNQVSYSMLNRKIEADLIPLTVAENIGIIAYSPMERGLLTGKYFTDTKLKENDHRNGYFGQFDLQQVKTLIEELSSLAHAKEVNLAQLVLRWTTLQKGITIVLAGARNAEQAISNAKAMDFDLTALELDFINQAISKIK
ncbi:aldo/keto reductase [Flavobacterium sp. Fl-318]|uniref:Aldo/keto reductase n=1 Tax=Flavobacterium cupriresistens TaxID=2893885 RepID=A0ABU4R640_9FLAO|nr:MULTISPECIES: aldo/keto reductase [unclassified Flavobacterium]MDX6188061.1 aldo/keto reductase [Flavobacterium sp. Fl-318]UFH42019.1 aldo/keto reductase [Flavobacterium sp. F-323]